MVGKGVWECGAKDLREENNEVKKKKGKQEIEQQVVSKYSTL